MNAKDVALEFVRQINSQNVDGLCELMTDDHRFIDALGTVVEGRQKMRNGWTGYFRMIPDYQISFDEVFETGNVVAAFGIAGGTYAPNGKLSQENQWQVPAAWRVEVRENLIAEWRVYTDNEPIRKLMGKQTK